MNSRPSYEMLQKHYQLPGISVMEPSDKYPGRETNPNLFLLDRGGNRSFTRDLYEGFKDLKNKEEGKKFKFLPGDQILSGDYFKGWNDSYFFQTNLFRSDPKFWHDPFKSDYFQGK